jgi:hypothetical protein
MKLTRDEILNMPAGREFDALICQYVMKMTAWLEKRGDYEFIVWQKQGEREPYKAYQNPEAHQARYRKIDVSEIDWHNHIDENERTRTSTDIAAAFSAFTSIRRIVNLTRVRPDLWEASIIDIAPVIMAEAPTAPLAIGRVLLLATMESE